MADASLPGLVVAIVVGLLQFGALFATVWVMIRPAKRQLRAYLSVIPDGINPYEGQSYLIGHIKVRNNGQIPARNVSIYSTIDRDTDGRRKGFTLEAVTAAKTALQPRAKMRFGTGGWNLPVTARASDGRIELDGHLYVWGMVTYTDSFGTKGWTKFCHRYPCEMFGKDGAGFRSISVKHARYHEADGNEVD
jgi:hypothetical protein